MRDYRHRMIKKALCVLLVSILVMNTGIGIFAADLGTVEKTMHDTAALMVKTVKNPTVDTIGGEWAILSISRSDYKAPQSYYDGYYEAVEEYVKDRDGVLHEQKYTEYSRVVIGLTSAGYDPRDVGGFDMTMPLADYEKTIWQGINGPIFALIALDCAGYDIPENPDAKTRATREMYIDEILRCQLADGSFSLDGTKTSAGIDITGMALQALAKYRDRMDVKDATDRALSYLSNLQAGNGGLKIGQAEDSEGVVQAIVALCELGIGVDDTRFIKNGNSLLDRLMDYHVPGKGFEHIIGEGVNQMATEQSLYALDAIYRFENDMNSLYDMSDVAAVTPTERPSGQGLYAKHEDVRSTKVGEEKKTFSDIGAHESKEAIEALASRGIISGMADGTFSPDKTMTRAQFAAIVTLALGLSQHDENPFEDVAAGSWYEGYVGAAYKYGIVSGRTLDTFDPEGLISKQEAACMVANAAKLCGMDTDMNEQAVRDVLAQFPDYIDVADYAKGALAFCYSSDILPRDEIYIEPARKITRGEIAGMLYRMLDEAKLL